MIIIFFYKICVLLKLCFLLSVSIALNPCYGGWESIPIRSAKQKAAGLIGGEGMQYVMTIAYSPSEPAIIYFGIDQSQVWKSANGGTTWKHLRNAGFVSHGARSIAIDPVNSKIIFAAGFGGYDFKRGKNYKNLIRGIYRSEDGGDSWLLLKKTNFFKQVGLGALFAFDSSSSEGDKTWIVYAGSYSEGLLKSYDGGETWTQVGFKDKPIIDIKEIAGDPGELLVTVGTGLYRYCEDGIEKIGKGLPSYPRTVSVSKQNPEVVYATLGKYGVYKSGDGGKTFRSFNNGLPININYTDIACSPVDSEIVYVKAHYSNLPPCYSYNGGKDWHLPKDTDVGGLSLADKHWFSSPFAPHPIKPHVALLATSGQARIIKTLDGGKNWFYSGNGFTGGRMMDIAFSKKGKMIFCLTDHGLFLTENGGDTFRGLKVKRILGLKSSRSGALSGNTIVASIGRWGKKGLVVSQNMGETWEIFDKLIDIYHFITFHPRHANIIYAGRYRSRDKGKTWTKLAQEVRAISAGNHDGISMAISFGNHDAIYAVSSLNEKECSILKSIDQGETWFKPYPVCPFPPKSITDIAISPDNPDRLYLASTRGLWILSKKKLILRNKKNGLDTDFFGSCYISCVSVDPKNPKVIYAGRQAPGRGQSNGIFRSSDKGLTWENITHNLGPELSVWSIKINPYSGDVYIGTSHGTYRLRNGDELTSPTMHHSFRPSLPDLKA